MKIKVVILFLFLMAKLNGQIKTLINDKEIKSESTVNLSDIETLKFKFTPEVKPNTLTNGILTLKFKVTDINGSILSEYFHEAKGTSAADAFVSNGNKIITVASKDISEEIFNSSKGYLEHLNSLIYKLSASKEINVKIIIFYQDKIGYEKYGTPVELVAPFKFKINTVVKSGYVKAAGLNAFLKHDNATKIGYIKSTTFSTEIPSDIIFSNPSKESAFYIKNDYVLAFKCIQVENMGKGGQDKCKEIANSFFEEVIEKTAKAKQANSGSSAFGDLASKFKKPGSSTEEQVDLVKTKKWFDLLGECKSDKATGKRKNIKFEDVAQEFNIAGFKGYKFNLIYSTSGHTEYKILYILNYEKDSAQTYLFYRASDYSDSESDFATRIYSIEQFFSNLEFNINK